MSALLDRVLEANGGLARWEGVSTISTRVRFGGLAFVSRLRFGTSRWRVASLEPRDPRLTLHDYPADGMRGEFHRDRVWLTSADGSHAAQREGARELMGQWRRQLWWDPLDLLYFAGYALWNYLTTPSLLTAPGVECEEGAPFEEAGQRLRTLDVRFPPAIPTHSPEQRFFFDEKFRLRRHDYDPQPFSSWARAAHFCDGHQTVDGFQVATRRRVVPRGRNGVARPGPTLVWIELADTRLQ